MSHIKDISGKQFGRLTAIKRFGNKRNLTHWICLCSCGKETLVSLPNLQSGTTKSCGCLKRELQRKEIGYAAFNQLFLSYKGAARRRNLLFFLSKEQFKNLTQMNCHYCNQEPSCIKHPNFHAKNEWKEKSSYIYNGIDRKDNTQGYNLINCVACCKICNYIKNDLNEEHFLDKIKTIYEHKKLNQVTNINE